MGQPMKAQAMSDFDSNKWEADRRDLFFALRTRVLTEAELEQARACGRHLNIEMQVSYYPEQKDRELADAWAVQGMMRAAAMQANAGYIGGANNSLFEIRECGT